MSDTPVRYRILQATGPEQATELLNEQAARGYKFVAMTSHREDHTTYYDIVVEQDTSASRKRGPLYSPMMTAVQSRKS